MAATETRYTLRGAGKSPVVIDIAKMKHPSLFDGLVSFCNMSTGQNVHIAENQKSN